MRKFDSANNKSIHNKETALGARRYLSQDYCVVPPRMLQTTKINIENPEHARV